MPPTRSRTAIPERVSASIESAEPFSCPPCPARRPRCSAATAERAPRAAPRARHPRADDRARAVPRRAGVGVHHRRHRLHPGQGIGGVLPARADLAIPHRHAVDAAVRRRALRHHGAAVGHAHQLGGRAAGRDPARHHHRDLPLRVRAVPAARDREAVPRAARRRADHRLRLLRAAVRHAAAAEDLSRAAGLQPALGGHRDGHHDHPVRELDLGGRDARGADEPARGLLRDGRDALPDRGQGGGAGGVLRHRRGLHPRASRARWARP